MGGMMRKLLRGRSARLLVALLGAVAVSAVGTPAQANPIEQFLTPSREYGGILPTPLGDPFYTPPPEFESQPPGTVLATRPGGTGLTAFPLTSTEVLLRSTDAKGRLMVLSTHNTDIADGWEREGVSPEYFHLFSVDSYAVGINVGVYTTTH